MTTTAPAQEAFLRAFHAEHPGVTAQTLGRGRTADGRSSYALLRDLLAGCRRVLDLGCGDGPLLELLAETPDRRLAGADLSPDDLSLARRRLPADTALVQARAQELPFAADSFDACAAHMSLMLMGDVEHVAREVARVLAPGGLLAVVLGGGAAGGDAFELFLNLLRSRLAGASAAAVPPMGDRRVRSRAGLDEVLAPAGFAPVSWETVRICLSGTFEEVWGSVSGLYDLGPMLPAAKAALRADFAAEAAALIRPDGTLPCAMRLHIATAATGARA